MATAKPRPDPAPRVRVGATFVRSPGGSAVRPATNRGEKRIGTGRCAAKGKKSQTY
jgi:hypothetical protein